MDNELSPPCVAKTLTICDLTTEFNVLLCVDHNLLFTIDRDDLRSTIGITGVVDQAPANSSSVTSHN